MWRRVDSATFDGVSLLPFLVSEFGPPALLYRFSTKLINAAHARASKGVLVLHMDSRMIASLRASATRARRGPARSRKAKNQVLSAQSGAHLPKTIAAVTR